MKTNHFLSRLTDLSRRFIKRASVVERPPHPYTTARVLLRLSCLVIGLSALIILAAWSIKMVELDQESLIILVSLVAIFGITLLLSEVFERLDIARILPPLIFFLFGLHASITTAATTTFILLYAIAILLSSAMHSPRSMWRMTGLCILAHTITRAYHYHSVPADFIPPSITISAELIGIAFVQDFIVGQFKHSIQKVERVSQQLQAEMIEREKAGQALQKERDFITQVMETSPAGIIILNREGEFAYVNSLALEILNLDRDEVKRRNYHSAEWKIAGPEGEPFPDDALPFVRVLTTGQPVFNVRHAIAGPKDQTIQLQINAAPLRDKTGEVSAVVLTISDITTQEKNLKALRDSENRLRTVVSNAPLVLWSIDREYNFSFADGIALSKIGLTPDNVVDHSLLELYQDFPEIQEATRRALAGEAAESISNLWGTYFDTRYNPLWDENGKVCGAIGIAFDVTNQKMAEARIEKQVQQLSTLHEIDQAIIHGTHIDETLKVLLNKITSQLSVDAGCVQLVNREDHRLYCKAWTGYRNITDPESTPVTQYAQQVADRREAIFIPLLSAVQSEPHAENNPWDMEGFSSYTGVPLVTKNGLMGVLELFSRNPLQPDDDWWNFLNILAGQTAISIENALLFTDLQRSNEELSRLFADLQQSNEELSLAYDRTLEGWARVLEMRSEEAEGHSQRVVHLAELLGSEMGLPADALVNLRRGALLHDIGKMEVPDHILNKPGRLNEEEWKVMRMHPVYAFQMLSNIPFLRGSLDIPYCHHEHWDGSGYPRGLKGEEIPLAARIFAIIDVWDALHSKRPYRPAWKEDEIIAYLRDRAGIEFDPKIVGVFLRMLGVGKTPGSRSVLRASQAVLQNDLDPESIEKRPAD